MIDDARLTRQLVESRRFHNHPISIVDVGASGGIDAHWDVFGDQLIAVGFDPLLSEVSRLNREARIGVRYVAAWVTSPSPQESDTAASTDFFERTSAVRASEIASLDYVRTYYNAGAEISFSDTRIVLDDYLDGTHVDFLKVDTDGHDYEVLLGSDRMLSSGRVLGIAVEIQFQGAVSSTANLFNNIDRFLRGNGFSLFDVEVHRYSRASLPAEFVYEIPAQTVTGQISWGDAIYFRDLGDPRYEDMWRCEITAEDVLKQACFFELFGLPDCAAELILKYPDAFGDDTERTALLDTLASESSGVATTYCALLQRFEQDSLHRFKPRD